MLSDVNANVPAADGNQTLKLELTVPAFKVKSLPSDTVPSNITPFDVDTVLTWLVVVVPVTIKSPGKVVVVSPSPICNVSLLNPFARAVFSLATSTLSTSVLPAIALLEPLPTVTNVGLF